MTDREQVFLRVGRDGAISAETKGVKGPKCLDYVALLEDLLGGQTIDSSFTSEYLETAAQTFGQAADELHN
ncbi:MAG: DUF2997 domain-containing protein [Coriobacteriia bacterium]